MKASAPSSAARRSVDPATVLRSLAAKGISPARLSDANLRDLGVTREQLGVAATYAAASAPKAGRGAEADPHARQKKHRTHGTDCTAGTAFADPQPVTALVAGGPAARKRKADPAPFVRPELTLNGRYLPEWCLRESLFFKVRFDLPTPSNNEVKQMHFAAYKKLRERFERQVREALGSFPGPQRDKVALFVVRSCEGGGLDWDNAYGGLKPMLDCLVAPSKRNPSGLGVFVDDNPKNMPIPPFVRQEWAPRGQGFLDLFVFDLAGAPPEVLERYSSGGRPETAKPARSRTTKASKAA